MKRKMIKRWIRNLFQFQEPATRVPAMIPLPVYIHDERHSENLARGRRYPRKPSPRI